MKKENAREAWACRALVFRKRLMLTAADHVGGSGTLATALVL
jgi:hypothetical protein